MSDDNTEDRIRQAMVEAEVTPTEEAGAKPARRPISLRNAGFAQKMASDLVGRGVRPNLISIASMGAALAAFILFWWAGNVLHPFLRGVLLLLAAVAVQGRLLCNMLDGMVALEGGMQEKDGAFWNEFPDRVSDILILGGLGIAAWHPGLGFFAAALAVTAAYTRELARANGGEADYGGPMAKQHRMAAVTGIAVLAAFWPMFGNAFWFMQMGLWAVALGTAVTIGLRAKRHLDWLNARG
jgi:phosphatidylglycerophosphate synthase